MAVVLSYLQFCFGSLVAFSQIMLELVLKYIYVSASYLALRLQVKKTQYLYK